MSQLWSSEAMIAAMGGRPIGKLPAGVTGISIDSRSLSAGEAFFAIRGERFDGHDFASAAMRNGAGLLVVSESKLPALGRLKIPMLVVDDVLAALGRLAIAARKRSRAKLIAITGSAGKTTTKEALRTALEPSGKVHASIRSFNNHWGVPLSLARMPANSDYGIFEIGMNHPNEIRPLVKLVKPHIAVITLIAAAHLGSFRNLEGIADAKAEIFEGVVRGGHALLNRDDKQWNRLNKLAVAANIQNIHGFGEHRQAKYKLLSYEGDDRNSRLEVRIDGLDHSILLSAPGRHMVQNALAVIGAVNLVGADLEKAISALASFVPDAGRGKRLELRHPRGKFTLIDESYNANPASMAAALDLLRLTPAGKKGRRIAVLGDMLELGNHSARLHAELSDVLLSAGPDLIFLGGREMEALSKKLDDADHAKYFPDTAELCERVVGSVGPGDVIVIKSSNGIGFSRIVEALVKRYPPVNAASRTGR